MKVSAIACTFLLWNLASDGIALTSDNNQAIPNKNPLNNLASSNRMLQETFSHNPNPEPTPTTASFQTPTFYQASTANSSVQAESTCINGAHQAKKVKIELDTGKPIHVYEVQVLSSGSNIASNKAASQSSTRKDKPNFEAVKAIDNDNSTYSRTENGGFQWWEVDLGANYPIEAVSIMNRWCQDSSDPKGCLCRLSSATVNLIDDQDTVITTQSVGDDTCGLLEISLDFSCDLSPSTTMSPTVSSLITSSPTKSPISQAPSSQNPTSLSPKTP